MQGRGKFFGLCPQKDKTERENSSGIRLQNDVLGAGKFFGLCLQNDVQGAWEFFGLCAQNDKAAQGDSSGFRPQNDMTHCDEPIRSDLSDENTQNPKCRDSEVNNNCRQGKRQRRVLSERSEFTRQNAESSKLLENAACGWFCGTFATKSAPVRRTKQKPEVDSSVASLLQNDVQGAWKFFGLCLQNDVKIKK